MKFVLRTDGGRYYAGRGKLSDSEDEAQTFDAQTGEGAMREAQSDPDVTVELKPWPHQPRCSTCGRRGECGDSKCANCWEVERRLAEYAATPAGLAFVERVLDEARPRGAVRPVSDAQGRRLAVAWKAAEAVAAELAAAGSDCDDLTRAMDLIRRRALAAEPAAPPGGQADGAT